MQMYIQINNSGTGQKMYNITQQNSVCSSLSQQSTVVTYPNTTTLDHPQYVYIANHENSRANAQQGQRQCVGYNGGLVDDGIEYWAEEIKINRYDNQTGQCGFYHTLAVQHDQSLQVDQKQTVELSGLEQVHQLLGKIVAATQTSNLQTYQLISRLKQIENYSSKCQSIVHDLLSTTSYSKLQDIQQKQQAESIVLIYEIPIQMEFQQQKQQLKISQEIIWLHQSVAQLTKQNQQLTDRIREIQQQLQTRKMQIINNIYEIPVQLQIQTEGEILDDRNQLDSEITIRLIDDEGDKMERIKKSMEINKSDWSENQMEGRLENFSFNNCSASETSHKKQYDAQMLEQFPITPEFENRQWAYINNIYEIPVEIIVTEKLQTAQQAMQTSARYRNLLRLTSAVVEYSYMENLLPSRKKRRALDSETKKKQEQHEQDVNNESMQMIQQQMQMLLQSEQGPVQIGKEQKRINGDSQDITYKAKQVTDSANLQKHQQMGRSDDIERESVLFMEFSNTLNSNQINSNKNNLLTPSKISKQMTYNNSQENGKPINEQDDENNYNEYDHSHSMEPSLINGISIIRNRQQHSQTQTNSQINDYLQVYNSHQHNNPSQNQTESYEFKNNTADCTGMNNCNHCGVSIKSNTKVKGFNNRSMGNNRNNQNDYIAQIENVIEERYSEESKSKRTVTMKNININVISPSQQIDEINENDDDNFMMMRARPRMTKQQIRNDLLNIKHTKEEERILQLGHSLFMQKSMIMESNPAEEGEKKKAKQRLSEHPYLNFYQTSELEQISQIKAQSRSGSQILKDGSKQQKRPTSSEQKKDIKSSFEQNSILINFSSSIQPGIQSREGLKFPQVNAQESKLNYNNHGGGAGVGVKNLKNARNQVYIIDGDTSSEGSRANRQMKISEMKHEKNKQISPVNEDSPQHCSKLKQNAFDMTEYYELNERLFHSQQQKSILVQKLQQSDIKVDFMRKQLISHQEKLAGMEQHYKDKLSMLLGQLNTYDEKLEALELQLSEKADKIEEQIKKKAEKEKQLVKCQEKIMKNQTEIKQLSQNLRMMEKNMESIRQKNMKQNTEKEQLVQQLRSQVSALKQQYYLQITALKFELQEREAKIEQYLKQIERNQEKIEHMKTQYHEMMSNLEAACREKDEYLAQLEVNIQNNGMYRQVSAWDKMEGIYESEFAKCRETYAQQIQSKSRKIYQLEMLNVNYTKQIKDFEQVLGKVELNLKEKQIKIADLQQQLKQKKKVEISAQIEEQLNYLRRQVVTSLQQLEYKEQVIRQLEGNIVDIEQKIEQLEEQQIESNRLTRGRKSDDTNSYNFQLNLNDIPHRRSVRNLFPLNFHTTTSIINTTNLGEIPEMKEKQQKIVELSVTIKQYELDIDDLKKIILNYEAILLSNQKIIHDLQQKVGEYLQDAMQRQRITEALQEDIDNYEAEINQNLKDKIQVEIENKRLKKLVAANDRKISSIGTRLIHAAKDKPRMKDQLSAIPISQNSTLKIRQLRIQ